VSAKYVIYYVINYLQFGQFSLALVDLKAKIDHLNLFLNMFCLPKILTLLGVKRLLLNSNLLFFQLQSVAADEVFLHGGPEKVPQNELETAPMINWHVNPNFHRDQNA
jgi:hypothetical protein